MTTHEHTIEVDRPVNMVYKQWSQFETFPQFMEGVESITQVDATHHHWVIKEGGGTREFDSEITENVPNERIAWSSSGEVQQGGVVTFHRLDDNGTRVVLQMIVEPEGLVETLGDELGPLDHRLEADLKRFKEFVESRAEESV